MSGENDKTKLRYDATIVGLTERFISIISTVLYVRGKRTGCINGIHNLKSNIRR